MAIIRNFDSYASTYDDWLDRTQVLFKAELAAFKKFIPHMGVGLEIGVGTGRMAAALGIEYGLDAAYAMCKLAHSRGINVLQGFAESMPFADESFDHILMTETLCLINYPEDALTEVWRVLKKNGLLVLGVINNNQALRREYIINAALALFYRSARFFTIKEIVALLNNCNFKIHNIYPTFFNGTQSLMVSDLSEDLTGEGGFIIITAHKN